MVSLTRQAPTYWCCFLHRCILNAKLTLGWLKGIWASNFENAKKIFCWVKKLGSSSLQPVRAYIGNVNNTCTWLWGWSIMRIITGVTTFEELSPTRASRGSNHPVFACKHFFACSERYFSSTVFRLSKVSPQHGCPGRQAPLLLLAAHQRSWTDTNLAYWCSTRCDSVLDVRWI